jgi:Acetyltransferase (GNAT) domain
MVKRGRYLGLIPLRWITSHRRIEEPFNSYGAFYNDRLLGFFNYSPANDYLGVQICYYVSDHCGGRGVATLVTETLVEKAFLFGKFEYVELHIDIANIPSQRVAQKVGFEPVVDYTCPKSGTLGSGKMQVWVKINPKTKYGVTLDDFREGKYEYLAPAYQDLRTAYEATQTMAILIDKLKRAKLALAGWMYADLFLALMVIFLATISFVPAQQSSPNNKKIFRLASTNISNHLPILTVAIAMLI